MTCERGSKDDVCFAPKAAAPRESGEQCGVTRSGGDPSLLCECPKAADKAECSTCDEHNGRSVRCQHCPMVFLSADHLARHMSSSHNERRSSSSSRESANTEATGLASRPKRRVSEKSAPLAPPRMVKRRIVAETADESRGAGKAEVAVCAVRHPGMSTFGCEECPKVYQSARGLKRHSAIHKRLVPHSVEEKGEHVQECRENSDQKGLLGDLILSTKTSNGDLSTDLAMETIGKREPDSDEPSSPTGSALTADGVAAAVKSSSPGVESSAGEQPSNRSKAQKKPSRAHRRSAKNNEPPQPSLPMDTIVCSVCQETYDDESTFAEHQQMKHGGAYPAACDICELQLPTPTLLRAHKIANHRSRRCRPADEKDPFSRWYVYADEQKHLKCDLCNYNSLWYHKGRFLEHYRIHTGERPYTCDLCGKQFRTRTLMHKHVTFVHEGVKEHACDLCGRRFSDKRYMEDHRRIHTGERPYVCDLCGKTFKQSASLFIHKELHKGLRKHGCDMCGKRFTTRSSLNIHIKRHVGERNFVCAVCGKAFVDGKHLRDHSTVHSDERPFRCDLCGARFKLMKHLKQHGRTHKRDFPSCERAKGCAAEKTSICLNFDKSKLYLHRCTLPSKPRKSLPNLKGHLTVRSTRCDTPRASISKDQRWQHILDFNVEEKQPLHIASSGFHLSRGLVCETCGKSFSKKSNLRIHERNHHKPVSILQCNVCSREFSYLHSLRRHQKKCFENAGRAKEASDTTASGEINCAEKAADKDMLAKLASDLFADKIKFDSDAANTTKSVKIVGSVADALRKGRTKALVDVTTKEYLDKIVDTTIVVGTGLPKAASNLGTTGGRGSKEIDSDSIAPFAGSGDELVTTPSGVAENQKSGDEEPLEDVIQLQGKTSSKRDEIFDKMVVIIDGRRCFKCDSCNYVGLVLSRMREHYRRHTGERPFTCEYCGRQFRLLNTLQNHIKFVHEGIRQHGCEVCGRRFAEKRYLQIHRRLHTGERLFVCDICGARFGHLASLAAHKQTHASAPSFQCPVCPNTYHHVSSYRLHMKRHRGELNYKCDVCDKAFVDLQHLQRHKSVHSEERPFACDVCGARFKLTKYLQSHKKTHRKVKASVQRQPTVYADYEEQIDENDYTFESAEFIEEKWDPLIKTSKTCSTLFAEDRAKLVKSKKLGPLLKKCKDVDVAILECSLCAAFFIDKNDFEKHEITHAERKPSSENEVVPDLLAEPKHCSSPEANLSKLKESVEKKGSASSHQKLMIKIGGNVMVKKMTVKKASKIRKSLLSIQNSKSTKKTISSPNFSNSKNYLEMEDWGGAKKVEPSKLKRKLDDSRPERTGLIGGDVDSSPMKKRKSAKHDVSDTKCLDEEMSVSNCEFNVKPSGSSPGRIRVANFAKASFSDTDGESKNADKKSAQSKKPRPRRAQRDDDDKDKVEDTYTCAHCMRNFRRKSNLKRHMIKLHCAAKSADESEGASMSKWFTGYCCDVCGEGLQHRATMMAHRDVVHGTQSEIDWVKYQTSLARVKFCADCKKYFRSGSIFDEHSCDSGESINDPSLTEQVRSAEEARPTLVCSVCNACFRWKWDLRLHREAEHGDAAPLDWTTVVGAYLPHLCEQCFKAYPSDDELVAHKCAVELRQQQTTSDETAKQYRCKLCDHEYFWKSDYRRHMRIKHPKENYLPTEHDTIVYSCPYCAEKFTLKKGILLHMRKVHNANSDSPFVCLKCNKVFRRRDNLDRHNESYHPTVSDADEVRRILSDAEIRINGDVTYHCAVCSRNIANSNRFISHYRGHYSESKFKCDLCAKQTRTQHQLNTHIKNIHLNIRNYRCDLCEKSFYTKQACEEHRRIHTGERPFSCEICGKTFIAGNALISHKRFHNDFYPHSCHLCPKKFKVRRSLVNHIRTHTGERPFQCDLCPKTFNNSSQYSYHKRVTHSEDRPFSCPICGNCFKANKFLTRHLELHNSSRSRAQGRKTKIDSRSCADSAVVGPDDVLSVAQPSAASAVADNSVEERGIKIFVTAPTAAPASPLADVPSIVNVVSTMPTTFLKGVNSAGSGAGVQFHDENILPGPSPLFNVQPDYSQYRAKSSAICDSNTAAYITTVEYVQVTDADYKPVISDQTYSTIAQQSGSTHNATITKNTYNLVIEDAIVMGKNRLF